MFCICSIHGLVRLSTNQIPAWLMNQDLRRTDGNPFVLHRFKVFAPSFLLIIFLQTLLRTAPVLHIHIEFLKYFVSCNINPSGQQRAWTRGRQPCSIRSDTQRPRRLHGHSNEGCWAPEASDQGSPRFRRRVSPGPSSPGEYIVRNHRPFML